MLVVESETEYVGEDSLRVAMKPSADPPEKRNAFWKSGLAGEEDIAAMGPVDGTQPPRCGAGRGIRGRSHS